MSVWIWIDAQFSPAIAIWISSTFSSVMTGGPLEIRATALRDIGLRDATDREIFLAARRDGAIVMTKDSDFVRLLNELGAPPKVIWITCGNTSNSYLRQLLLDNLVNALRVLQSGSDLIEIS